MKDWQSRKVRFVKATLKKGDALVHARVELERPGSGTYVGTAEGAEATLDVLRTSAQAAAQAVQHAADTEEASVEIRDLEIVKARGGDVALVSVLVRLRGEVRSLFGVCQINDDPATAGALAVLSATNRVFDLA